MFGIWKRADSSKKSLRLLNGANVTSTILLCVCNRKLLGPLTSPTLIFFFMKMSTLFKILKWNNTTILRKLKVIHAKVKPYFYILSNIVKDFLIAVSKWFFNRTNAWKEAFVEKRNKDSEQHWLVVKNSLLFVWYKSRIYPKSGIYIAGDCWNTSTNCRSVAFIRNFELTSREHPPPPKKTLQFSRCTKSCAGFRLINR